MFSLVRAKGGFNDHPTVIQARAALRSITCNRVVNTIAKNKNCEDYDLDFLLPSIKPLQKSSLPPTDIIVETTDYPEFSEYEVEALKYVCGYMIYRFISCKLCKEKLIKNTTSLYIQFKQYSNSSLCEAIDDVIHDAEVCKLYTFQLLEQISHLPSCFEFILNYEKIVHLFNFPFLHNDDCKLNVQKVLQYHFVLMCTKTFCKRSNESFVTMSQQKKYENKMKKLKQK